MTDKWCAKGGASFGLVVKQLAGREFTNNIQYRGHNETVVYYLDSDNNLQMNVLGNVPEGYELVTDMREIYTYYFEKRQPKGDGTKIVAYQLLKDLPEYKAGVLFHWDEEDEGWIHGEKHDNTAYFYQDSQIKELSSWFRPVFVKED